jgi:hypothetical protein
MLSVLIAAPQTDVEIAPTAAHVTTDIVLRVETGAAVFAAIVPRDAVSSAVLTLLVHDLTAAAMRAESEGVVSSLTEGAQEGFGVGMDAFTHWRISDRASTRDSRRWE